MTEQATSGRASRGRGTWKAAVLIALILIVLAVIGASSRRSRSHA